MVEPPEAMMPSTYPLDEVLYDFTSKANCLEALRTEAEMLRKVDQQYQQWMTSSKQLDVTTTDFSEAERMLVRIMDTDDDVVRAHNAKSPPEAIMAALRQAIDVREEAMRRGPL